MRYTMENLPLNNGITTYYCIITPIFKIIVPIFIEYPTGTNSMILSGTNCTYNYYAEFYLSANSEYYSWTLGLYQIETKLPPIH